MVPGVTFGELDMYVGDVSRVVQNQAYQQPSIYHWQDVATGKQKGMRMIFGKEVYTNASSDFKILAGGAHLTGGTLLPNTILKVDIHHAAHVSQQSLMNRNVAITEYRIQNKHENLVI